MLVASEILELVLEYDGRYNTVKKVCPDNKYLQNRVDKNQYLQLENSKFPIVSRNSKSKVPCSECKCDDEMDKSIVVKYGLDFNKGLFLHSDSDIENGLYKFSFCLDRVLYTNFILKLPVKDHPDFNFNRQVQRISFCIDSNRTCSFFNDSFLSFRGKKITIKDGYICIPLPFFLPEKILLYFRYHTNYVIVEMKDGFSLTNPEFEHLNYSKKIYMRLDEYSLGPGDFYSHSLNRACYDNGRERIQAFANHIGPFYSFTFTDINIYATTRAIGMTFSAASTVKSVTFYIYDMQLTIDTHGKNYIYFDHHYDQDILTGINLSCIDNLKLTLESNQVEQVEFYFITLNNLHILDGQCGSEIYEEIEVNKV